MVFSILLCLALAQAPESEISDWVRALRSEKIEERDRAAASLRRAGPRAIPELEKELKSPDSESALLARHLIRSIKIRAAVSPELARSVPRILERLDQETEGSVVACFLQAAAIRDGKHLYPNLKKSDLEGLAPFAVEEARTEEEIRQCLVALQVWNLASAAPQIERLLEHPGGETRSIAAWTLSALHAREALPAIRKLLQDRDPKVRAAAGSAVGRLKDRPSIPALRSFLKDPAAEVRICAARALADMKASEALPDFFEILGDKDSDLHYAALEALEAIGAKEAAPAIVRCLSNPQPALRNRAVRALQGLKAADSGSAILPLLEDPDAEVRQSAAYALGYLGIQEGGLPLARLLKDSSADVRYAALHSLGVLGNVAQMGDIVAALDDPDRHLRCHAAMILADLGRKEHAAKIVRLLEDEDSMVCYTAAEALGKMKAEGATGALAALLRSPSPNARSWAATALGRMEARDSAPDVLRLLEDADSHVRSCAVWALGAIQPPEALPKIRGLLADGSVEVCTAAAWALGNWEDTDSAGPISGLLSHPDHSVRWCAIQVLTLLKAREKSPEVEKALKDTNGDVRVAAAVFLCRSGSRAGVETLLGEKRSLWELNAVRRPGIWSRLRDRSIEFKLDGWKGDLARGLAKEAGLALVEPRPCCEIGELQNWTRQYFGLGTGRRSILDTLSILAGGEPYQFVLEEDRILILSDEEALAFWTSWKEGMAR